MKRVMLPVKKISALFAEWPDMYKKKARNKKRIDKIRETLLESKFFPIQNLSFEEWVICIVEGYVNICLSKDCILCDKYRGGAAKLGKSCLVCPLVQKNLSSSFMFPNVKFCNATRSPYGKLLNITNKHQNKIELFMGDWWQIHEEIKYHITTNKHSLEVMQDMYIKYGEILDDCIEWINVKVREEYDEKTKR